LETQCERILIDAGLPDLANRFPPGVLTRIALTHFHPDHVQGLFHLRWGCVPPVEIFCPPDKEGCADLYKNPGILKFRQLKPYEPVLVNDLSITPLPLIHSKTTFGYCFESAGKRICYLTDTIGLPPETRDYLMKRTCDLMVVDCSYPPCGKKPGNHNDINHVLQMHSEIASRQVVLTHVGHELDRWLGGHKDLLPEGMIAGADGMMIDVGQICF